VEQSLRRRRSDLPEERLREQILEGALRVDVRGMATGQVNGLAVVGLGDLAFGHAIRITATVSTGDGKVVDIDRDAELSGPSTTRAC
jgi:predicted ATP-dependent protease